MRMIEQTLLILIIFYVLMLFRKALRIIEKKIDSYCLSRNIVFVNDVIEQSVRAIEEESNQKEEHLKPTGDRKRWLALDASKMVLNEKGIDVTDAILTHKIDAIVQKLFRG